MNTLRRATLAAILLCSILAGAQVLTGPGPLPTDRGLDRLLLDLARAQATIRVGVAGNSLEGKPLNVAGAILTLETHRDGKKEYAYIPTSAIQFVNKQ